jgi:hypothetical protein
VQCWETISGASWPGVITALANQGGPAQLIVPTPMGKYSCPLRLFEAPQTIRYLFLGTSPILQILKIRQFGDALIKCRSSIISLSSDCGGCLDFFIAIDILHQIFCLSPLTGPLPCLLLAKVCRLASNLKKSRTSSI